MGRKERWLNHMDDGNLLLENEATSTLPPNLKKKKSYPNIAALREL